MQYLPIRYAISPPSVLHDPPISSSDYSNYTWYFRGTRSVISFLKEPASVPYGEPV
jgi:hypothetical protein